MTTQQTIGFLRSLLIYYNPLRYGRLSPFYAQFVQPGDLCFDIGAHVGNRIRTWLHLGARVVAAEPQPHLMAWLRRWYGRFPQVALVEQAVGASQTIQTLFISQHTPTVTTLSQEWITAVQRDSSFAGVLWDTAVSVPVTTLDALIALYGEPVFCKIDVEGYELEVLRGLSRPLRALSFEFVPAAMGIAEGCIQRLGELAIYEYNWSMGEQHRWESAVWLPAGTMLDKLQNMKGNGHSGDIYGRLKTSDQ